jgi:hypothetical protein
LARRSAWEEYMRQDAPYERFRRHPKAQDYYKEISLNFIRLLGQVRCLLPQKIWTKSNHLIQKVTPRHNGSSTLPRTRVQSSDSDDASFEKGCEGSKILYCTFASRTRCCRELESTTNYTKLAHLHVSHDGRVNSTQADPTRFTS